MKTFQEVPSKQAGVTLIELMIGLVVGLIVVSGAIYTFIIAFKSSRDVVYSARLNQELAAITTIIADDIRRAGHWVQSGALSSPYDDMGEDFNLVSASCALYNYDVDGDGLIGTNEHSGVRFSASSIWVKTSGTSMTSCSTGTWERLSDENFMSVNAMSITDSSLCIVNEASAACPSNVGTNAVGSVREIDITITASVINDTDWTKTVQESVKIRNDFYAD
ncbi:PilW family protein [Neptuniibacter sp. QD48_11]|uniref:PilW family protein n=1 Tax=unclassified Neptuniibacter TaxID=2630693 RepID=UPI0039F5B95D